MKSIYILALTLLFCGCAKEASTSEWYETRKEVIQGEVEDTVMGYMLLRYLDDSEETIDFSDLNEYLLLKGIELKEENYISMRCKSTESGLDLYVETKGILPGSITVRQVILSGEEGYLNELKKKLNQSGDGQ